MPAPFLACGWKRGSRSRSGQRFALPPSAADCPPRDREPLFTLAWLGANGPLSGLRGAGREEYSQHPPTARSAWAGGCSSHPPAKAPKRGGARVRFYRAVGEARANGPPEERSTGKQGEAPGQARRARALGRERSDFPTHAGRGIDGPPEDSPRPKAVERSAGRRRTIDSSPLQHAKNKEPTPAQGPLRPPMALLVLLPRPTRASLIPPRLLGSGHRHPHALPLSTVGHQLSRILG